MSLPTTIPFAVAEERVVTLTTFGGVDARAVLRGADGRVIERIDDRTDDWNVALSRRLPAGAYTLELSALPGVKAAGEDDEREPRRPLRTEPSRIEPALDVPVESGFDDDVVEVALSLPASGDAQELRFDGVGQAEGPHVHRFSLPAPIAGSLLVIAARGTGELMLSLERQEPDGSWMTRGLDRGRSPLVAAPAETDGRPWRVSAWVVDGAVAGVWVAARAVTRPAQPLGDVALESVTLDTQGGPVFAALVAVPGSALVAFSAEGGSVREGSTAGQALAPAGPLVAPQSDRLWLVSRAARKASVVPAGQVEHQLALNIAEGAVRVSRRSPLRPAQSGSGGPTRPLASPVSRRDVGWAWLPAAPLPSPATHPCGSGMRAPPKPCACRSHR